MKFLDVQFLRLVTQSALHLAVINTMKCSYTLSLHMEDDSQPIISVVSKTREGVNGRILACPNFDETCKRRRVLWLTVISCYLVGR